jgi:hypothetical protein
MVLRMVMVVMVVVVMVMVMVVIMMTMRVITRLARPLAVVCGSVRRKAGRDAAPLLWCFRSLRAFAGHWSPTRI